MGTRIVTRVETGEFLAGWDTFGQPKYTTDVRLADRMNFPTASRVALNLKDVFSKGEHKVLTSTV